MQHHNIWVVLVDTSHRHGWSTLAATRLDYLSVMLCPLPVLGNCLRRTANAPRYSAASPHCCSSRSRCALCCQSFTRLTSAWFTANARMIFMSPLVALRCGACRKTMIYMVSCCPGLTSCPFSSSMPQITTWASTWHTHP